MNFIISRRQSSGHFYAYYNNRFWFWDDSRSIWTESHLMAQKYERERLGNCIFTPEEFMADSSQFQMLDEHKINSIMVDALKTATPCKSVPIAPVKEESECTTAQSVDAAATTEENAVPSAAPATPTTSESEADANASSPAISPQSCESSPAASAEDSSALPAPSVSDSNPQDNPLTTIPDNIRPEFDYSGLADQTVADLHLAENEYLHGKKLAERGLVHMGDAIAIAHDALCGVVAQCDNSEGGARRTMRQAHNNQHSEDTFRAWCLSIGITKDSAYRLLQVSALMDGSSPRQKEILEALPPTLLYAAAKPSAPPELVEKVKNGEISSNKEYQALLKENQQLRTDRVNAMNQAEREKARADRAVAEIGDRDKTIKSLLDRSEAADAHAEEAESHYKAALSDLNGLTEQKARLEADKNSYRQMAESAKARADKWLQEKKESDIRAQQAEQRAKEAEAALKKQPITAVVDEEEVDRRAAEKAWGLADARNAELAQDNANLKKQLDALRSRINDDAQADFEQANYCASLMRAAWDNSKASYSRLVGEDLESTFQTICATLNAIQEEASLLCRQPPDYDGGDAV